MPRGGHQESENQGQQGFGQQGFGQQGQGQQGGRGGQGGRRSSSKERGQGNNPEFEQEHPRDPQTGQFVPKEEGQQGGQGGQGGQVNNLFLVFVIAFEELRVQ